MLNKIKQINKILDDQGDSIIQKKTVGNQTTYGYKAQAVFDAVNEILGPENWMFEVLDQSVVATPYTLKNGTEKVLEQAIAEVAVYFRLDSGWFCKGPQIGQSQVVNGNVGDARKGAITDAIQKGMSLWGIGSKAYRGDLRLTKPKGQSANTTNLPKLEGVSYEKKGDILYAKGKTYGKSEALKSAGFAFDGDKRVWWKKAA